MTNEEIVLKRINSGRFGVSKLMFDFKRHRDEFCYVYAYQNAKDEFNDRIKRLKNTKGLADRVYLIVKYSSEYDIPTYTETGHFQCGSARRSTFDIWRIYRHYFGEIDIFSIMRALYRAVDENGDLDTYRCPDIGKRVFWTSDYNYDDRDVESEVKAEIGVPFSSWEKIGLEAKK